MKADDPMWRPLKRAAGRRKRRSLSVLVKCHLWVSGVTVAVPLLSCRWQCSLNRNAERRLMTAANLTAISLVLFIKEGKNGQLSCLLYSQVHRHRFLIGRQSSSSGYRYELSGWIRSVLWLRQRWRCRGCKQWQSWVSKNINVSQTPLG